MTRLLVSVRDGHEASGARLAGADLIDAKDPSGGSLGALPVSVIRSIVAMLDGGAVTSAVAGDHAGNDDLVDAARVIATSGVSFVKVGLRTAFATPRAIAGLGASLAGRGRFIAVLFADEVAGEDLAGPLANAGFAGAMIDTQDKTGGRLVDFMRLDRLAAFVGTCRGHGLICGLAGSLRIDDIVALAPLGADYLGFRGGLCHDGDRRQALDFRRIRRAADLLSHLAAPPSKTAREVAV